MKFLKQCFNFYINSSVHVALSVFSLTWITLLEFDLPYNEPVLYFIFYGAITGYNFVKYFGIAKFHHKQLAGWLKLIQIVSFFCFLVLCYYSFQLKIETLFFIAVLAVLTFLYAIPITPKKRYTLRTLRGVKVYIIALVWTGVTVFMPLVNEAHSIGVDEILLGVQRFLYILVLMLPFEIRDLKYDGLELITIPQRLGVRRTKILGGLLLLLIFVVEFFKDDIKDNHLPILFVVLSITLLFLVLSKINQGKYYSSFWVEALPIVWLVLLLVFA